MDKEIVLITSMSTSTEGGGGGAGRNGSDEDWQSLEGLESEWRKGSWPPKGAERCPWRVRA